MKLTGMNQLWVAHITYIRLKKEFVYLAVILDAFLRKVVGWATQEPLPGSSFRWVSSWLFLGELLSSRARTPSDCAKTVPNTSTESWPCQNLNKRQIDALIHDKVQDSFRELD